ncbi:MAG: hypothetical protein VX191_05355 [Candidatus Thermoplasmatota archaeon]|nr:hypothetical protein [Candidatus Thermoplasmatota archaeon]MEC9351535.1 hypothetical protein [Candidatus Thermoplasmatota archaeon]MEC9393227.1 hypothetical protein [Candidatus Thermoplasmatota archaeon]MED6312917.1 hypothetical protein [Candidatus Thermoplasmatota archaeon]MEE3201365.1 hypothetical protein [Candidatus Thermoplasmatota archaeon]
MDAKAVIECLDYTLLDFEASEAELEEFVSRANSSEVGAICVFSEHASFVKERLDERIKLAVVAAGFPIGSSNLDEIRKAITSAVEAGVDEIDVVLEPRQDNEFPNDKDLQRLVTMREASGECVLKVILETPLLQERPMRAVARMALASGADFIKTCTGKRGGCSDDTAAIFAYELRRHERAFGEKLGVKLSGGIRNMEDVKRLTSIVDQQDSTIIEDGATRFRIGASSLLDSIERKS